MKSSLTLLGAKSFMDLKTKIDRCICIRIIHSFTKWDVAWSIISWQPGVTSRILSQYCGNYTRLLIVRLTFRLLQYFYLENQPGPAAKKFPAGWPEVAFSTQPLAGSQIEILQHSKFSFTRNVNLIMSIYIDYNPPFHAQMSVKLNTFSRPIHITSFFSSD